jgi:hypothetical protein
VELSTIRTKLLPQVVQLYQEVCLQAADWLTLCMDDTALRLQQNVQDAISTLDEAKLGSQSPIAPQYWARQCLEIVNIVASDKYRISSIFGKDELQALFEKLVPAAGAELL